MNRDLETIAATAPAQRCFVVFKAPDPFTFPFSFSSTSIPSTFSPLLLFPRSFAESNTYPSFPITDRLTDRNTPFPNPILAFTPPQSALLKELTAKFLKGSPFRGTTATKHGGRASSRNKPPGTKGFKRSGLTKLLNQKSWSCIAEREVGRLGRVLGLVGREKIEALGSSNGSPGF